MKTEQDAIKNKILTGLAKHTSGMSDVQLRKHWLEFVDQAFDQLLAQQKETYIAAIENMVRKSINETDPYSIGKTIAYRDILKAIREL